VAVKVAAVTAAGLLVTGGGIEGKQLVEKHHLAAAPPAAEAAAKPKPSAVAKAVSSSALVRSAPTVVRPSSTAGSSGRSEDARAQRESGATKGLGRRITTPAVALGVAEPTNRGQTQSTLARAKETPSQAAAAATKAPVVKGESHAATQATKTTPARTTKTPPKAKTTVKKHTRVRKPLRDEPVRPVTPPTPPRPDTSGEGRVNPHG
jgi:hypothetical protein